MDRVLDLGVGFVDTAPPEPEPDAIESGEGVVSIVAFMSRLAPMAGGPRGYVAQLDKASHGPPRAFSSWWNEVVIQDIAGHKLSRRDIVLMLANKDGGAHVDAVLPADYAALAREGSLGTIG